MTTMGARDLRNDTAGLLRRVQAGEEIVITLRGQPVAELVPVQRNQRTWMDRDELLDWLEANPPDPGLREDMEWISSGTTDELGPIQ